MLEFFQFATSSFWTFCGVTIIISLVFTGVTELVTRIVKAFKK
jgi:hypothetical protein